MVLAGFQSLLLLALSLSFLLSILALFSPSSSDSPGCFLLFADSITNNYSHAIEAKGVWFHNEYRIIIKSRELPIKNAQEERYGPAEVEKNSPRQRMHSELESLHRIEQ